MTTTVITGALGRIGSKLTDKFAERGHEVIALDRRRPVSSRPNISFKAVDLTDQGETWDVILEANPDIVLHFAGVRSGRMARKEIFNINTKTTYNVLTVAAETGADIVWASSERAYGFPNYQIVLPNYLPIDEEHPLEPESSYGGSKAVGEVIAGMIARYYGVNITSVRATWVCYPGEYNPDAVNINNINFETASSNFWSYVDIRDLISFIDSFLNSDIDGHEPFNVSAPNNHAGVPTIELFKETLGEVPEKCDIEGEESVYSTAKAERLLDWEPEHTWREGAKENKWEPSFLE